MTSIDLAPSTPVLAAIDISKHRHEVLIEVPENKRRRRLTVLNTLEEFNRLIDVLAGYQRPVRVAFEATGNYHRPLAWHLGAAGFETKLVSSVALARTALRGFIRDRTVICIFHREAQQDIVEAECMVGGKDIAEWLVRQGCAVSADGARYAETMKEARQDGRGLWRDGADADLLLSSRRAETATSD